MQNDEIEIAMSTEERFYCKGVFEALDFAFRNPKIAGFDENSTEYQEIKRAYWSMPWALDAQIKAHNPEHKCNDYKCNEG